MIQDISSATPAEIDTEFARLQGELHDAERAEVAFNRVVENQYSTKAEVEEAQRRLAVTLQSQRRIGAEIVSLNAEYARRGGWTRYYMVDNTGGHLHTTTACRNTYRTTPWYWMTGMSGLTSAEAVALGGGLSCLTCFPGLREIIEENRPCRIETLNQRKSREQREADAKAKAEKAAKAAVKAITMPDGSPLYTVRRNIKGALIKGDLIKTEIAASRRASEAAFDLVWYGRSHPMADEWKATLDRMVVALAHKRGITNAHDVLVETMKKAEAKYKRETR